MRDQEWILEHLKVCRYQVEAISYLGYEKIEKSYEELYLVKLNFFGETVERIVYRHGKCLDMISKNIQVKDMLGKADKVFYPRSDGQEIKLDKRCPIMGGDLNPDTVLFYEDYVSLREHFFEGKNLVQLACFIRSDDLRTSFDYGKYGLYKLTVNVVEE